MDVACENLSFRYRPRSPWVIRDLTWTLTPGTTFLLGPNGAGKSTLLALLATALRPTAGALVGVDTTSVGTDVTRWRRRVGWIPQHVEAVPGMTVREQVAYAGWLKGLPRTEAWSRAGSALERVRLSRKADEKSGHLSGGQMRRLAIASALVHDARVVLMDEPTAGLDPNQRTRFYDLIANVSEVDYLISTHQTEDLDVPHARVAVMSSGEIIHEGSRKEFLSLGRGESAESRARDAYRSLINEED